MVFYLFVHSLLKETDLIPLGFVSNLISPLFSADLIRISSYLVCL